MIHDKLHIEQLSPIKFKANEGYGLYFTLSRGSGKQWQLSAPSPSVIPCEMSEFSENLLLKVLEISFKKMLKGS